MQQVIWHRVRLTPLLCETSSSLISIDANLWHKAGAVPTVACIHGYEKDNTDTYPNSAEHIQTAIDRGAAHNDRFSRRPVNDVYTDIHELVTVLGESKKD